MSAEQLERSVLESKEREELHAIAEALGLRPGSRASKATLIGNILKATGVDDAAPNGDAPPKRSRTKRVTDDAPASSNGHSPAEHEDDDDAATPPTPVGDAAAEDASMEAAGGSALATETHQQSRFDRQDRQDRGGGQRFDSEPGNRRSRRRRGRDRGERGERSERDLQGGGGPEPVYQGEP